MEHQPEIILGKPQVTSLDLSLFFRLNKVCLLLFYQWQQPLFLHIGGLLATTFVCSSAQTVSPYIQGYGVGVSPPPESGFLPGV